MHDPAALIRQLRDNPNDPAALALYSMLQAVDRALENTVNERNIAQDQLLLCQTDLRAYQSDFRKKSELCDILTTHLAALVTAETTQPAQLSASQPLVQPAVSHVKRLSKDPDKFDGEEKEIKKRQQIYINWKSQLRLCYAQDSAIFNTEKVKILHTVGLLTGDAYNNNRAIFEYMTAHPNDVSSWACKSSDELFAALNQQYETLDLKLDASIDFDQLFQRKTAFPNFIAKFETLAYQCGKTDEQKVDALKKKISQELAEKLTTLENPPAANDYLSWVKRCRTFYENIHVYEHNQSNKTGFNRPQARLNDPPARPSTQQPPGGDPMQLDQTSLN
jgi:hypothetical protein